MPKFAPLLRVISVIFGLLLLPRLVYGAIPVSLGVVNWIGYGPIYCAAATGAFARYGLEVRLVTFADNGVMPGALQGGEVDASALTYDQVIGADAKGWKLKVVLPLDYSTGGDAIVATADVRTVKDLAGRKVAFAPLSASDFLLGYALEANGLTETAISPVNTTPEGVAGILVGGSAAAGVTYEPTVSVILRQAEGKRFHILLSSRDARGMVTDVLVLREDRIEGDPKLASGLVHAILDGVDFMQREPAKAAAIIGKALDLSPAEVAAQLQGVENPPLVHAADVFEKSPRLPSFHASGAIIGGILIKEGQIDKAPPIESTFDARFVKALQSGG